MPAHPAKTRAAMDSVVMRVFDFIGERLSGYLLSRILATAAFEMPRVFAMAYIDTPWFIASRIMLSRCALASVYSEK